MDSESLALWHVNFNCMICLCNAICLPSLLTIICLPPSSHSNLPFPHFSYE